VAPESEEALLVDALESEVDHESEGALRVDAAAPLDVESEEGALRVDGAALQEEGAGTIIGVVMSEIATAVAVVALLGVAMSEIVVITHGVVVVVVVVEVIVIASGLGTCPHPRSLKQICVVTSGAAIAVVATNVGFRTRVPMEAVAKVVTKVKATKVKATKVKEEKRGTCVETSNGAIVLAAMAVDFHIVKMQVEVVSHLATGNARNAT